MMPTITDWLMVAITIVYVIATIAICRANMQSAKASKEQLAEMQKQYADENRPFIEAELIYERKCFYGIRLVNHGKRTAQHVKIQLSDEFVQTLPDATIKELLMELKEKECIIGVGQHYDFFIGNRELGLNIEIKPLTGKVIYSSTDVEYSCDLYVDLKNYMTIFSVNTDQDDLLKVLKEQTTEIKRLNQSVSHLIKIQEEKDNA